MSKKESFAAVQVVSRFNGLFGKKSAHDGIRWAKLVFPFRQSDVSDPRHEQRKTKELDALFFGAPYLELVHQFHLSGSIGSSSFKDISS